MTGHRALSRDPSCRWRGSSGRDASPLQHRWAIFSAPDPANREEGARFSGMVVVDGGGRIMLVNREIERLFGYPRDELLGQPIELAVATGAVTMRAIVRLP